MDKLVKGENEMWKMPAKEHIQTKIVSASAVKRVLGFRFAQPPTSRCSGKKETHINYYAAIILITEMWQKFSGENLRLLKSKILTIFGSTILLLLSIIIYLNKCNRFDIMIFRL